VALSISHDNLMIECGVDNPKDFGRFLKASGFAQSSTYDKRTANTIAWRLGREIKWYTYRGQQGDDRAAEPLRRGIASDLLNKLDQRYRKLSPETNAAALDQPRIIGLVCADERLLGRRITRQDHLRFLRKPFKSFDLGYAFWEVDNYFLGRPYPFPLAYFMRLVPSP
jgi:hypothetical protein